MRFSVPQLLPALLCWACLLPAQDVSGTIQGSVLDPSSAAVPAAKITFTNLEKGQLVRTVRSEANGVYVAPVLPVGTYSIRVEATGFKQEERRPVTLNVNDDLKIDFKLVIGSQSDKIEVTEDSVAVELGSPAAANTIDSTQISELALGTRNYETLMALMPGVAANAVDDLYVGNSLPSGSTSTVPFFVNGMRNSANNYTVDGADNMDRGSNLTLSTYPSVDSIQQFKVERTMYTADTGRAGGAQINVVTKSGAKDFHGGFYEFFRNDALNANLWNNNANSVNVVNGKAKTTPVRWNDFGGTIGGPVFVPGKFNKDRNKTFFFYSQEWRKIINYNTFNPTLPTVGMINNSFLQPVCVQFNGTSCALTGTSIAPSLINPNSAAYVKDIYSKLPLLNGTTVAATTGGYYPVRNIYDSRQEIGRFDHQFNERFSIWGRFTIDDIPTTESAGLGVSSVIPNAATTSTNSPGRQVVGHAVNVISPTIYNDAGYNFSESAILIDPIGLTARTNSPDINPATPFKNPTQVVPSLTFTSGSTLSGRGPYRDYNFNYAWFDNLTWIRGRHSFRFGFSQNRYEKTENASGAQGTFGFTNNGAPSGTSAFQQSFANFLQGNVATFSQPSMQVTPDIWAWQAEAYAQDDFKVTAQLTVFAGVRWSYFGQPTDNNHMLDNFDPATYDPAKAPKINTTNGTVIPGTANWQTNGIIVGGKNSPYGQKISNDVYNSFAPRVGLAWDPFGNGKTAVRAGYGLFYDSTLFGTYEQNIFADPPFVTSVSYSNANFSNVAAGTQGIDALGPQATAVLNLHATQVPAKLPYSQQWNLDIQRRLPGGAVLDVAYVGSKGTHLLGIVDINEARPGVALAAGLHAAGTNTVFTSTDQARINAVRPYQGFGYIQTLESGFDSRYHSLQVQARKNFGAKGLVGASYTFSKVITNASSDRSNYPQNSYDWTSEKSVASFNRKHVLSLNYVYHLPFFARGTNLLSRIAGGWELSGIVAAYTGQPLTAVTSSVDPAGLGLLGDTSITNRPDLICNANDGAPHQWGASAQGLQWISNKCFAAVPQGQVRVGNAGNYIVMGPNFANLDASLLKNFRITGDGRWRAQLRVEGFNVLNLVNPAGLASLNITATNFGQVNSFRAARRMQLALKINF